MKSNKLEKVAKFIKQRKYYIAVSLCILTIGAVGLISYQKAQNVWDSTPLPEKNTLDTQDVLIPQTDVTDQEAESASKPTKQPEQPQTKPYILPVDGTIDVGYSENTPVYSKTLADWRTHSGIDYTVALGTEVKAINDGVVENVSTDNLMGVTVSIKHPDGNVSTYANLEKGVTLKKDQLISQGDIVGKVGKSAIIEIAQEPHLHFEVTVDGKPIDPLTLYDK
ncbi:MAG: M23 family metallopeptidase [Clostridia bacterium]|nr:M23 family metallopeptidase [Clostridia bacterium]